MRRDRRDVPVTRPSSDEDWYYVESPSLGAAHYVSAEGPEAVPFLWVPDPERPSMYVERPVKTVKRRIGFV